MNVFRFLNRLVSKKNWYRPKGDRFRQVSLYNITELNIVLPDKLYNIAELNRVLPDKLYNIAELNNVLPDKLYNIAELNSLTGQIV